MFEYPESFLSDVCKSEFLLESEYRFERQLDDAAEIIASSGTQVVCIAGPSCSGKTTTTAKLIEKLTARGFTLHSISFDDYYRDRDLLKTVNPDGSVTYDYESVNAIDLEAVSETVKSLTNNVDVYVPTFDFESGVRSDYRFIDTEPGHILLFEGIQAVYPEVTELFSGIHPLRIYINVRTPVTFGAIVISPADLRKMRRIVRDYRHRGATSDFILTLWPDVVGNERINMEPYSDSFEIQIDSTMAYGPGMLKDQILPLLEAVSDDHPDKPWAEHMLGVLANIVSLPVEYLPLHSVYREFVD